MGTRLKIQFLQKHMTKDSHVTFSRLKIEFIQKKVLKSEFRISELGGMILYLIINYVRPKF